MTLHAAIGIDPGPVPGLVLLGWEDSTMTRIEVVQCTHGVASWAVRDLIEMLTAGTPIGIGIERFVVSRRSGRSSTAKAGEITRDLIGQLVLTVQNEGAVWHLRAAGEVKPWATDERLDAAGLLEATKGMRHARDAARHALFTAVRDCGLPDPLSKKAVMAGEDQV